MAEKTKRIGGLLAVVVLASMLLNGSEGQKGGKVGVTDLS